VTKWASYNTKVCADIKQKLDARNTFQDVAVGAFIAGGAAVAGTAVYLLWPSPRAKTMQHAAARDLRLTPVLGPTSSGLLVSGSF
jgi:hypothetical protein